MTAKKLYVNRKYLNFPYGGGNMFVKYFYRAFTDPENKLFPEEEVILLNPDYHNLKPDISYVVGLGNDPHGGKSIEQIIMHKMYNPNTKIVLRVNENDARKNTYQMDENLKKVSEHVDGTVFVSNWLADYFKDRWLCKNTTVIHNGVDPSIFKPNDKLNNNKINIVTHHWSDHSMKGADIYEKLDQFVGDHKDDFSFTYIGRTKSHFRNSLVIPPIHSKALGDELGKYDVYVSASRFDPGPNHILESVSCEIPTYVYKDGGGCIEFAGKDHVYNSWEELEKLLLAKKFEKNIQFQLPNWYDCIKQYVEYGMSL